MSVVGAGAIAIGPLVLGPWWAATLCVLVGVVVYAGAQFCAPRRTG